MTTIRCHYDACVHNIDRKCNLSIISIETKFGEFRSGERECHPTCCECKEAEGEAD